MATYKVIGHPDKNLRGVKSKWEERNTARGREMRGVQVRFLKGWILLKYDVYREKEKG